MSKADILQEIEKLRHIVNYPSLAPLGRGL